MSLAARCLIGLVRLYQGLIRPLAGCNCRFHPSCSDYGLQALQGHGAAHGALLTLRRIVRCNPWMPGGYDPVPDAPRPRSAKTAG